MTDLAPDATGSAWPTIHFDPRRLGHVNLFVSDLEASFAFYHDVCGLELAFDETELFARFLSNGNSHHDLAIMEATGRSLVGRDGEVQITGTRGSGARLNHLAFEMDSEAQLVAGIRRAHAADCTIHSLYDHLISRSAYLPGPDGVEVEVYADSTLAWRELYASLGTGLMSARWELDADRPPSEDPLFTTELDHRPVPGALAQPLRTARAAVVTSDLDDAVAYYEQVVGLHTLEQDLGEGRWAVLGGRLGLPDLLVLQQLADEPLGFHHFGLELASLDELSATEARLADAGVAVARTVEHARKRGIVLRDPDGMAVELFATIDAGPEVTYASVATAENREHLT